jgi:hypothetical protein
MSGCAAIKRLLVFFRAGDFNYELFAGRVIYKFDVGLRRQRPPYTRSKPTIG